MCSLSVHDFVAFLIPVFIIGLFGVLWGGKLPGGKRRGGTLAHFAIRGASGTIPALPDGFLSDKEGLNI